MRRFALVSVALASLMLAACASTPTPPPAGSTSYTTDQWYVAQVEGKARQRGVAVVWVNPPKSRIIHQE
jgi:ABC-type sugar transport system substrate-binding protein